MSPWVMVTAYFARSCWISTMSSVLVDMDLASFHYKTYVLCNADVQQRVARHGDDVGEQSLGEPAPVGHVDQVRRHHGRRAQHRGRRHAPVDKGDKLVGVLAVWDGRCVGADRDPHTSVISRPDRGA